MKTTISINQKGAILTIVSFGALAIDEDKTYSCEDTEYILSRCPVCNHPVEFNARWNEVYISCPNCSLGESAKSDPPDFVGFVGFKPYAELVYRAVARWENKVLDVVIGDVERIEL